MDMIKERYEVGEKSKRLFEIDIAKDSLIDTISFLMSHTDFITLSMIACADWIEDEIFVLNYVFTTSNRDKNLMLKVSISRDGEVVPTVSISSPQAEVMERDLHEMYGIVFDGNDTLYDFALEGWEGMPPLRRDFDTLEYVNENFDFKGGRDDNKDVKAEVKRRKAEAKKLKALKTEANETEANEAKEAEEVKNNG